MPQAHVVAPASIERASGRRAPLSPEGAQVALREVAEMKYYRFFPGDYEQDTVELTFAENGIYRRLLDWQYSTEEPIRDVAHACVILKKRRPEKSNYEKGTKKVRKILEKYFPDGWNARFLKELNHVNEISSKRRKAAFAKHLHSISTHTLDIRQEKRRTTNIELSQDHPPSAPVENPDPPQEKPSGLSEEKNLPNGNDPVADQLHELRIELQKLELRKRGLLP
jgi:uncharacterized protein YdaU (DUF1376 family)